ncbi:MAG: Spx/MgsR family RNA polymerase-binding regulatory protein [Rhodospirillales bacterium]|nr:Spx/MgsR family RNA polymerase-binding regulatory protein [Rhodospirillales bacterium]
MIAVYGLKNCDTCRKALKWLAGKNLEHRFHDFRKHGIDAKAIEKWADAVGWETLLNKRGTTWRGLADSEKDGVGPSNAAALMAAHPALIKRPVFEVSGRIIVGFKDEQKNLLSGG